jgi:hypothetical protein
MLLFFTVLPSRRVSPVASVHPPLRLVAAASWRPRLVFRWVCEQGQTRAHGRWLTHA